MTNQSTIDKLIEMRLTAMADAFRIQMDDPTMKEVPFEDRFGMLVDVEYSNRKNARNLHITPFTIRKIITDVDVGLVIVETQGTPINIFHYSKI